MTSARDIRAMVSSIDRCMQVLRGARGADVDVEARKKSRDALVEDIDDATALLRTAKRSGVDASRLVGKIETAQKLLGKDGLVVADSLSNDGSDHSQHPNTPEPRHPGSPPPPPTPIPQMERLDLDRRSDDNVSLRSSVAARNAVVIRRREEEIRRRDEDVDLKRRLDAIAAVELESTREREAMEFEILRIRHQREEIDAEEEDQRRNSSSNGSVRV